MPPSIVDPLPAAIEQIKLHNKTGHATTTEALEAAKARFVERNIKSLKLHEESSRSLPGGNTRSVLHTTPFPVFLKSGKDSTVTSEDGHTYTDFMGEFTAGIYGHSQPLIQKTLVDTIQNVGLNLGGTTISETKHAALICSRFKLDLVRFTNSGTEANLHAIAGARRFTGKRKIVAFTGGYHGGCYTFNEGPAENCVDMDEWIMAEYNDIEDTKRKIEESDDVAAVLVEGMQGRGPCIVGTHQFLQQIQTSARKVVAVFILDEIQTSRLAPGGLQETANIQPDLTTLGKYLGGGMAFGAFGGKKAIMRLYDPREKTALGHSGTFNNNTLGMAAGHAGLSQIFTPDVCREFGAIGDKFRGRLEEISQGTKMTITGLGTIMGIHFLKDGKKHLSNYKDRDEDADLRNLFWYEAMEENFWISQRGSLALILGTLWSEMERFVKFTEDFIQRHEGLMKI